MTQDNRPMRYIEWLNYDPDSGAEYPYPVEQVVYRASSLGSCDVAVLATAAGMQGADRPEWFQEVLDEGTIAEGVIACMWEEETEIPTINDQLEVELVIGEIDGRRVIIRGHIDGESEHDQRVGREYKKFRDSTWEDFLRQGIEINKNYPWQLSVYWYARGWFEAEVVGGHVKGYVSIDEEGDPGATIYATPKDAREAGVETFLPVIGEVKHKLVTAPPIPLKDIRRKIVRWERLINEGTPLSEGRCEKPYAYPCPFFTLHPDDDEPEVYAVAKSNKAVGESIVAIHDTTTQIAALAAEMRVLDKLRKQHTEILKEGLAEMGEEADTAKIITYDGRSITRTRGPRKGYTVQDGFTDSFAATKEETEPKPRKAAAKTKTTRVGKK